MTTISPTLSQLSMKSRKLINNRLWKGRKQIRSSQQNNLHMKQEKLMSLFPTHNKKSNGQGLVVLLSKLCSQCRWLQTWSQALRKQGKLLHFHRAKSRWELRLLCCRGSHSSQEVGLSFFQVARALWAKFSIICWKVTPISLKTDKQWQELESKLKRPFSNFKLHKTTYNLIQTLKYQLLEMFFQILRRLKSLKAKAK